MNILTIDIGGTFIKYAVMTEAMDVLAKGKAPTPQEGRAQLIGAIGQIYDKFPGCKGIALSMPGIIDTEKGYCAMGGALGYNDDFYLREALSRRCPVKIHMENDAKCAAMAEAAAGALRDVSDGFVLIFGTMIGGAFIKDHKLHKGRHFSSGEVSYIATLRDSVSRDSVWGNRCGTPRLCRMFEECRGLPAGSVDGVAFFAAVDSGDADALFCLRAFTKEVAVQIFNLQTVLDPERFAIGGGISVQPSFIGHIREHLDELYRQCPYRVPHAQVVACQFHNDANLIGALHCFLAG